MIAMPDQAKPRIKAIAQAVSVRPSDSAVIGHAGLPATHIVTLETNDAVIEYYLDHRSATLLLAVDSYLKPFQSDSLVGTPSAEALNPSV